MRESHSCLDPRVCHRGGVWTCRKIQVRDGERVKDDESNREVFAASLVIKRLIEP